MKCPVCSAELPSTAKFCGGCGATITPISAPKPSVQPRDKAPAGHSSSDPVTPSMSPAYAGNPLPTVEKKYKALRLIALLYKILAFVAGAAFVILGLVTFVTGIAAGSSPTTIGGQPAAFFGGAMGGLILLVYGLFLFVFLYGLGEWMYVFMDIEENTRKTNETLASRPR